MITTATQPGWGRFRNGGGWPADADISVAGISCPAELPPPLGSCGPSTRECGEKRPRSEAGGRGGGNPWGGPDQADTVIRQAEDRRMAKHEMRPPGFGSSAAPGSARSRRSSGSTADRLTVGQALDQGPGDLADLRHFLGCLEERPQRDFRADAAQEQGRPCPMIGGGIQRPRDPAASSAQRVRETGGGGGLTWVGAKKSMGTPGGDWVSLGETGGGGGARAGCLRSDPVGPGRQAHARSISGCSRARASAAASL